MSTENGSIPTIIDKSKIIDIINTMNRFIIYVEQELMVRIDCRYLTIDHALFPASNIKHFEDINLTSSINFRFLRVDGHSSIISILDYILKAAYDFELACDSKDENNNRYIVYIPTNESKYKDYIFRLVIKEGFRYSMSVQYKDPVVKYVDANPLRCKMNFKSAYYMMLNGYKITRPCFNGIYWTIGSDGETITENCGKYKTAVGTIADIVENVMANDWQVVDEKE